MHLFGDEELEAVKRVFEKGRFFRYQRDGKSECDHFEDEFSKKLGVMHSLILSSGTNALIIALEANNIGDGDEVIIPAYTFVATAAAVLAVGAIPIIANIDDQLLLDPEDTQRLINEKTKAIIPVHMDGLACNMEKLLNIAKEHNLLVVEDVAQAMGGSYNGKALGGLGDVGCFSLNQDKNLTCGEGGIIICNDEKLYQTYFCLHDTACQFNPVKKEMFTEIETFVGHSMRVSEISGAIMREQLKKLDRILKELRDRKQAFINILENIDGLRLIRGHSLDGDCASSLHMSFSNAQVAQNLGKVLREKEVLVYPPTMRPAHASWKWSYLLNAERAAFNDERNPYKKTKKKYNYAMPLVLETADKLMSVLKIDIDIKQTVDQHEKIAEEIRNAFQAL